MKMAKKDMRNRRLDKISKLAVMKETLVRKTKKQSRQKKKIESEDERKR